MLCRKGEAGEAGDGSGVREPGAAMLFQPWRGGNWLGVGRGGAEWPASSR